jgi:hypothetical protein
MSILLEPVIQAYRLILQPIAPFTWFGLSITSLDLAATVRLCVLLRQIKDGMHREHVKKHGGPHMVEEKSFVKSALTTLTVVYGGEAVLGECLNIIKITFC